MAVQPHLATPIPSQLLSELHHVPITSLRDNTLPDKWVWKGAKEGIYKSSSGYVWLLNQKRCWDPSINWDWIWKLPVPAKVQHFIWLYAHNALPTNDLRHRRHLTTSPSCLRCSAPVETALHCLRDCPPSKDIWEIIGLWDCPDFHTHDDASEWVHYLCSGSSPHLFLAGVWCLWLWRNNFIFNDNNWNPNEVIRKFYLAQDEYTSNFSSKDSHNKANRLSVRWSPPSAGFVKINADGSFIESSTFIGSGGVLRSEKGEWVSGFSSFDGTGDILLAELMGIYHGLVVTKQLGYHQVIYESDCLDAVNLINNHGTHVFHAHAGLLSQIMNMMNDSWDVTIVHCLREANVCADYLAREGVNSNGFMLWDTPPPGLTSLLLKDGLGC